VIVVRRGSGFIFLLAAALFAAAYVVGLRLGYVDRLQARFFPRLQHGARLSSGDFPAGVAAPVGELASVPLRPTLIGFTPRGSSAALLLATGGIRSTDLDPRARLAQGLLKLAYSMEARSVVFAREDDLRKALAFGAENGGVDMAAISVDRLAQWWAVLRDAAPRTVLLLGGSQGQEALAAVGGVETLADLRGKRIAAYSQSSAYYFALWALSRVGLGTREVRFIELDSSLDAGNALREGRADAAAGFSADLELATRDRAGKILTTTADAPHLVSTILVARGEFAARYPGAVRRILRGLLDAGASVRRDSTEGARLLGEVAPYLGDPAEAIRTAPPADLKENLAFFGLSGESPVTYDELFSSAAALFMKIGKTNSLPSAEDTRDIGALRYVSEARRQ
jgi:ABC-type nitrate/sulfonate/bicarbonate transport system substrate-binding protein